MANVDILNILQMKQVDPTKFQFDMMMIPPMNYFLSNEDVEQLRQIATSLKLASKITQKLQMINNIMVRRGFKKFQAGTNRVIYRFEEDKSFVVKIAVDRVGMKDNPAEFLNQQYLKPFVAKTFYISQCGTVAFSERVEPITRAAEFEVIADDIYELITNKILGTYVMEDIGTKYFMNWGTRLGFGPVLLDYTYLYHLDGNKLFCNYIDPDTHIPCDGIIDYDDGFNNLKCNKCGKRYLARELKKNIEENSILINDKGGNYKMIVKISRGKETVYQSDNGTDSIIMPRKRRVNKEKNNSVNEIKVNILNYREQSDEIKNYKEEVSVEEKKDDSTIITVKHEKDVHERTPRAKVLVNGKPINDNSNNEKEFKVIPASMLSSDELKKQSDKIEEMKKDNYITPNMVISHPKMIRINTKIKLSASEQMIDQKICDGLYYFDENGVLRKPDGTPHKFKNLRLKAKDYIPVVDLEPDDEDDIEDDEEY